MLTHLHISDFTLVDTLDLELQPGLTTVTGETGAGKSITLDALALALGDRADADKVRPGAKKADIHASFCLKALPFARKQLEEQDLDQGDECILRRVVTSEGRSRAYINGHTVTLQQLRSFGESLIDIHSQHEHQSLLKTSTHRRLLDDFGGNENLVKQVKTAFNQWHTANQTLEQVRNNSEEINARFQLLRYQVEELDQLDLQEGELEALEEEQKTLANSEEIQQGCQQVSALCSDDEQGLSAALHQAIHILSKLPGKSKHLEEAESLFRSASIHVEEAQREIDHHTDSIEDDASRLPEVEARLTAIYDIARKHRIQPEELIALHQSLADELASLRSGDDQLEALEQEAAQAKAEFDTYAAKLSEKRAQAAKKLSTQVNKKLKQLAMENALFDISLLAATTKPNRHGNEEVEFLISTHPGQAPKALSKIASGGELSRISLAIQVVTAQTSTIPTMVFDEVDVGIGGPTGDIVGQLLRELGEKGQVICVTHLAQVASKAHQHLYVNKSVSKKDVKSDVSYLSQEQKVAELARMMGGDTASAQSLAHAKEMLEQAVPAS